MKRSDLLHIQKACPGLNSLCRFINAETVFHFNVLDVVYFIRHVSIAIGCKNACLHCFSNSPLKITQTSQEGFQLLINEIGLVLRTTQKPLSFFHLGAATDPSSICNYYRYLLAWREAMPDFQVIKVFTHGWWLEIPAQQGEFWNFIKILKMFSNIKVIISFDCFSMHARENWSKYISNICENLRALVSSIGKDRVRLEVFYSPERSYCDKKYTLQYWRERIHRDGPVTFDDIISQCMLEPDNKCANVTMGVAQVFSHSGLETIDLHQMTRDCECVFPSGRAKQLYNEYSNQDRINGLEVQRQRVLYSLENYEYKYDGIIINPNGSAQLVNYWGYRLGAYLNESNPVIQYMSVI